MKSGRPKEDFPFKMAILGCGFVSASYAKTLPIHPEISIIGVCDNRDERSRKLARKIGCKIYKSIEEILQDENVEGVINLTNPKDHFITSSLCLEAGKHVYSEKPLGMNISEATKLRDIAEKRHLSLSIAPCSVLSPSAQTLWKGIRDGLIGKVLLIYANFDDGLIAPHQSPWSWENSCGIPWPAKDEFEVGCTFEHAGYFLTWLLSIFGPVSRVTSFASTQILDKGIEVGSMAPDFTCGCLEFNGNIVARVTCGLVAPKDKSLTIIGDKGVLSVSNLRDDYGPVWHESYGISRNRARVRNLINRIQSRINRVIPSFEMRNISATRKNALPMVQTERQVQTIDGKKADFMRGPVEMVNSIREKRASRLPSEMGVHMVEIINELQYPSGPRTPMTISFPKVEPV